MALTLDTTLSGLSSNSYVDVAYADNYWENHYSAVKSTQWDALSANQKTSALIAACAVIERYKYAVNVYRAEDYYQSQYDRGSQTVVQIVVNDKPFRAQYRQKLQFPRNLDYDDSGASYIPEPVKNAQCEQALYLTTFDETVIANQLQGITQDVVAAGPVRTSQNYAGKGTALAPMALELLSPYFYRSNSTKRA